MVIDIKLCRFENITWGFRLVGGADFEIPLTVVKVTEGSIADEADLRVGDVIVRINDIAAAPLSHEEAHQIITKCGNVFYFGVSREQSEPEPEPEPESTNQFPIGIDRPLSVDNSDSYPERSPTKSPVCYNDDGRPNSVISDLNMVDEEIAAVMSGESEVLKDHNVIGVNFHRIFPKPGVCRSSEVLRELNAEAIKTKSEKEKENKKWTTFLQKPNRPIPKSKADLEAEARRANAYKLKIVKQPRRTPERSASPAVIVKAPEPEPVKEPTPPPTPTPEIEEEPPTDSEVPNLEEMAIDESQNKNHDSSEQQQADDNSNYDDSASLNGNSQPEEEKQYCDEEKDENYQLPTTTTTTTATATTNDSIQIKKTDEELLIEKQLADVQRQLLALSTLPSTIQATLDAVTRQLSELLPTFKLQQTVEHHQQEQQSFAHKIETNCIDEEQEQHEDEDEDGEEMELNGTTIETVNLSDETNEMKNEFMTMEETTTTTTTIAEQNEKETFENHENYHSVKFVQTRETKEETRKMEEEQNIKKQKKHDVIEELEGRLERQHGPKRSKRAFGPLVPQERPLVLPGGRRWYRPKDAYNDEFIAETLSAQAELITGSTLGCTYESPLLGYDPSEYNSASVAIQLENSRVNFMKYQKPEKKIDLEKSEVYKVIHHLDRRPIRGIEVRPPVVAAEADIRKAIHS